MGQTALFVAVRSTNLDFLGAECVQRVVRGWWDGSTRHAHDQSLRERALAAAEEDEDEESLFGDLWGETEVAAEERRLPLLEATSREVERLWWAPRARFCMDVAFYLVFLSFFATNLLEAEDIDRETCAVSKCAALNSVIEWYEIVVFIFALGSAAQVYTRFSNYGHSIKKLIAYPFNVVDVFVSTIQIAAMAMRIQYRPVHGTYEDPSEELHVTYEVLNFFIAISLFLRILVFLQVSRAIGPLFFTVATMFKDIGNWLLLAVALVLGFTFGLVALLSADDLDVLYDDGEGIDAMLLLISAMIGALDADVTSFTALPAGKYVCFVLLYMVVAAVLLLNLLIAMMSHSYEDIVARSKRTYRFQFTRLFLFYDRHRATLPVPFNLLPFTIANGYQVGLVLQRLFLRCRGTRHATEVASPGRPLKRATTADATAKQPEMCRYCMAIIHSSSPLIFCARCGRHGVAATVKQRMQARVGAFFFWPAAFGVVYVQKLLWRGLRASAASVRTASLAAAMWWGQVSQLAADEDERSELDDKRKEDAQKHFRKISLAVALSSTEKASARSAAKEDPQKHIFGQNRRDNLEAMKGEIFQTLTVLADQDKANSKLEAMVGAVMDNQGNDLGATEMEMYLNGLIEEL